MREGTLIALAPLRRYADFAGRSTRTELAAFSLIAVVAGMALGWGVGPFGARVLEIAWTAFLALLLCPAAALLVRRLHDQGKRGWWALLGLPALALAALEQWARLRKDYQPLAIEEPVFVGPLAAAGVVALFILAVWPGEEGPNRFGPDPRYGDPEAA